MVPDDADGNILCACKGIRRCLLCEKLKENVFSQAKDSKVVRHFQYNPEMRYAVCDNTADVASFPFPGVILWEDFISEEEEKELICNMDQNTWMPSQSGRRKQDFGPKVNFKKKKVRLGAFAGLPEWSRDLVLRMQQDPDLVDFHPVEQCNLEYCPERGSSIDPHLDDAWLWGERLVTLNLLSDTVLTMSLEEGHPVFGPEEIRVAVRLPRRSLVVLHGEARHHWKHAILRTDVHDRRVCSTFRELSADFLPGGPQGKLGRQLLDVALSFQGTPI